MIYSKEAPDFARVLGLFIVGYFLTSFFNQANSILAFSVSSDINLSSYQLAMFTGVYFLSFGLFQIPLGILLDRFGSYSVQTMLFSIAGAGLFFFANATSYPILIISKLMIGVGLSGGLMAGFQTIIESVSASRAPIYITIFMAIGTLGGLFSTAPLNYLLAYFEWRSIILVFSGLTLFTALLLYRSRHRQHSKHPLMLVEHIKGIHKIFRSQELWRLAPLISLCAGVNLAMVSLWGAKWMSVVNELSQSTVASHLFMMTLSLIIGILSSGFISSWINKHYKVDLFSILLGGLFIFIICQCLLPIQSISKSPIIWMIFGFSSRWLTLGYAILASSFSKEHLGKSLTVLNFFSFTAAFSIEIFMGRSVHYFEGVFRLSESDALRASMMVIVVLELIAFIWLLSGKQFFVKKEEMC